MKRLLAWIVMALAAVSAAWWVYSPFRAQVNALLPPKVVALLPVPGPTDPATPKAEPKRKGPPPAPVTVANVQAAEMPVLITAPGTVEAAATIAIKTRVDGQLAEVLFKEGDLVEKGQVLYRLDDRLIKAQIQQAEATVRKDEASLAEAEANFGRRSVLAQKKIVSESTMDTARTSVDTLKASIAAGKAALEAQKTQLDYLVIRSPLRGRTGASAAQAGSNVRAADVNPLVTINQTQPVQVAFAVPQTELPALKLASANKAGAEILVPGRSQPGIGQIVFLDNQVDKATGTVTVKIEVANTDEFFWPGQAVEVVLTVEKRKDMLSVPASAVQPSQQGMIVWTVGPENRVQPRVVMLDRIVGQTAYVSGGVKAGDVVVTDGQVRIAPGAMVIISEQSKQEAPRQSQPAAPDQDKGEPKGKKGEPKAETKGTRSDRRS